MTKMLSASARWGLCPQTPVIGSCSALAMVPPQPLTPSAAYACCCWLISVLAVSRPVDTCRLCLKGAVSSDGWTQSAAWIVDRTQAVVKSVYGATLKLATDHTV